MTSSLFNNAIAAGLGVVRRVAGVKTTYYWKDDENNEQSVFLTGAVQGQTSHESSQTGERTRLTKVRSVDWLIEACQLMDRGEPEQFDRLEVERLSGETEVFQVSLFGPDRMCFRYSDQVTRSQFRIHTKRIEVRT